MSNKGYVTIRQYCHMGTRDSTFYFIIEAPGLCEYSHVWTRLHYPHHISYNRGKPEFKNWFGTNTTDKDCTNIMAILYEAYIIRY